MSLYEVKVIGGKHAHKWMGVDSWDGAVQEFGAINLDADSFRAAPVRTVEEEIAIHCASDEAAE